MPHYARATVTTMTLAAGCNHISILILCYQVCSSCCKTFQLSTWWNYKSAGTVTIYLLLTEAMRSGKAETIPTDRPFLRRDGSKRIILPENLTLLASVGNKTINPLKFCLYRSRRSYYNHFCWLSIELIIMLQTSTYHELDDLESVMELCTYVCN